MWHRLTLAAVLVSGTTAAAETPWPLKTPAELRALHGPTFTGMQILTYRHAVEPAEPGTAPETTIGIGRDIVFREEGGVRFVVDLRLGRTYEISRDKQYIDSPMAASIVARDVEMANRVGLGKALAAAGIAQDKAGSSFDPFWNATELKVTSPGESPPVVETRQRNGVTTFLYQGKDAIRWQPAGEALPPQLAANLRHALLWLWRGHPYLTAQLAAVGKAPQQFAVRWEFGNQARTDEYQLIDARWCETCDPLPADAQPGLKVGGVFETELAPVMVAASQGKLKALSSDDYLRRIDDALNRGAVIDGLLWFLEAALQDGMRKCPPEEASDYCRIQNRLFSEARANSDVQVLQRNMATRSLEAASALAAMRDKVGANAYYLDLASIDAIPESALRFKTSEQEPLKSTERRMASALAAMPLVPAVYRDIGNIYFAAVDTRRAWLAWEMGMANPGRSMERDLWRNPRGIEMQARQRHPEFF
jgi:hypothetical protein